MRTTAALALTAALVACGGPEPGAPAVPTSGAAQSRGTDGTDRSSQGEVAAQATEPRTVDPTGARAEAAPGAAGGTAEGTAKDGGAGEKKKAPPARIGARHVLIQWMGSDRAPSSVVRTREQALSLAKEVHRRAKAGEDFARLAVEYSDEPGAGGRGGSLGRFGKGQMVGAFEEAAFKLEPGQISDIVETPFGYHVIQRTD